MNRFLDGGLIANNPTLDIITEIHKYNSVFGKPGGKQPCEIGIIVSLGTGVPPPEHVTSIDVFKPESVWDTANVFSGARALGALLVDQVNQDPVVRKWVKFNQGLGESKFLYREMLPDGLS